jgi:type IV secretory pathway VirB10-like protein
VTHGDNDTQKKEPAVQPISGPAGLDLNPKPESPRRVSRRAAALIGGIVILLFLAFAYGGYKRSANAQAAAAAQGSPKAVAPATAAGSEFTKVIPPGNAAVTQGQAPEDQLLPPADNKLTKTGTCGVDPSTRQPYRFDPMTGRPCDGLVAPVERVAIRRARPAQPAHAPQPPPREPTPEERRLQELYRREQEALVAPTGIRSGGSASATAFSPSGPQMPSRQNDLAQIAALGSALTGSGRSGGDSPGMDVVRTLLSSPRSAAPGRTADDYDQNMQTRKEQFLETAASKKGDDYLRSTRTAPLSEYEIKAGWEIPAVLEQSLNSDLPGEIKALVMSNVYDTATGRYLLIPQGSRLVGKYDSHITYGQDGLQVVWNRIIFPDASSVDLAGMEGLDSQGNAGLRHKVDRHYKRLFGFAALTSLFTAAFEVSQRRNQSVLTYPNPSDTAAATVGREMSQTGAMITRRNLNVQPTIKVPVGYKFTVRVNRDILFDAPYEALTPDPQVLPPGRGLLRRSGM